MYILTGPPALSIWVCTFIDLEKKFAPARLLVLIRYRNSLRRKLCVFKLENWIVCTVFPRIVSAETILFWIWPYVLWPLVTVHKSVETIQGRKLFKGGNYSRKYGIYISMAFNQCCCIDLKTLYKCLITSKIWLI